VPLLVAAAVSLACWVGLTVGRSGFFLVRPRLADTTPPSRWPAVAVVVPARDEADLLPTTLPTVLGQDYPGPCRVVLVDDQSSDGTAAVAESVAATRGDAAVQPLTVLRTPPRPAGWTGKLWALHCGTEAAGPVSWLLFTDADVAHPTDSLRRLVAAAEAGGVDELSLMVRLEVTGGWDRLLVPAFVYFFALLYPFRRVSDGTVRHAAAAGGCALVRRAALDRAGGVAAIRGAIIDDVALAQCLTRSGGRVWLGHTDQVRSVRPYGGLRPVWDMVARSAYTQLRCSPLRLLGTVVGLGVVFLLPPATTVAGLVLGDPVAAGLAGAAYGLMALTWLPLQRAYGHGVGWALSLPVAAALYLAMTVDSARRHRAGRGAAWKGRTYGANPA
jgi:hopene-associated glycosyltransferase HpnB